VVDEETGEGLYKLFSSSGTFVGVLAEAVELDRPTGLVGFGSPVVYEILPGFVWLTLGLVELTGADSSASLSFSGSYTAGMLQSVPD
jgi:hypothetical protein